MMGVECRSGSASSSRRATCGAIVAALSLLAAAVSATGCGFVNRGDGGLVPAMLGLAPPSRSSRTETASTSEPAAPVATPPAVAARAIAPKPPPQAESAKPAPPPVAALHSPDEPSVDEKLQALRRLRDRHAISEAEYESRRMRLLEQY